MRLARYLVLILLVALAVVGIRHINAGSSQTFTGCVSSTGALSRVQIGPVPKKPCDGLTQVSWQSDPPAGPDGALGVESQSCPAGEVLVGFDGDGGLVCDAP